MHTISELQHLIEKAVGKVEYPAQPLSLYAPIRYIMQLGGKRIRPALLILSTELFSDTCLIAAIEAALAIETFHNFTLIHDDIMDNAPLRRGKDTVHIKWGTNNAILSGDVMMVEANKHLTKLPVEVLKDALNCFNLTAQGVCEGQQLDMEFEQRQDVTITEYLQMIRLKTAVLVGGAMKLGAIVAEADPADADLLYTFGENFGIAFQLQDDILDVYGDPLKFGKQVGGDIISNKQTFLLLKLKELASPSDLSTLQELSQLEDQSLKIQAVTRLYDQYQVRDIAAAEMLKNQHIAFQALEKVNVPATRKNELMTLAQALIDREH